MHWIALQPASEAPDSPAPTLVDLHAALGWWALQFTPLVARVEDALVLEVSGSERLFGGRDALLQRLFAARPGDILDDHGLAKIAADSISDDASYGVARAAG